MKTKFIAVVLTTILLCSCDKRETSKAAKTTKPLPTFDHATFLEVTPMLDGSAYATSLDSRLWYLRGNKAVRVTVVGDISQQLPEFSDITPVIDGSAYATTLESDAGVWYLQAGHAEKVHEVDSLPESGTASKISDKAFYALYLAEHKKRKEAEDSASNPPESVEEPYDQY